MRKLLLAVSVAAMMSVTPAFATEEPAADAAAAATTETTTPAADASATVAVDAAVESHTVADVVSADANLSTLVSALKAAEWIEPLKGAGPYTVFAPTNAAFEALPAGTVEEWLKPENKEKLQAVLKHHVVAGKWSAADIAEGSSEVEALDGTKLAIMKDASGVTVGGAKVTTADVAGSNGVVHVVDKVITP